MFLKLIYLILFNNTHTQKREPTAIGSSGHPLPLPPNMQKAHASRERFAILSEGKFKLWMIEESSNKANAKFQYVAATAALLFNVVERRVAFLRLQRYYKFCKYARNAEIFCLSHHKKSGPKVAFSDIHIYLPPTPP